MLKALSAIDPIARGHSVALRELLNLPNLVRNVLQARDVDSYQIEVHRYMSAIDLPSFDPKEDRINVW